MVFVRGGLCCLALALGIHADAQEIMGKKKKGMKGRYLQIEAGANLADYRDALVILEPAVLSADKDRPIDNETVRQTSDELLKEALQELGVFGELVDAEPANLPEDGPSLRIKTTLTLQHGSRAMRYFVGAGAGKSKLHIQIEMVDASSGKALAKYNGFGSGAGFASFSGGAVSRMAHDDLQENYKQLTGYLAVKMK